MRAYYTQSFTVPSFLISVCCSLLMSELLSFFSRCLKTLVYSWGLSVVCACFYSEMIPTDAVCKLCISTRVFEWIHSCVTPSFLSLCPVVLVCCVWVCVWNKEVSDFSIVQHSANVSCCSGWCTNLSLQLKCCPRDGQHICCRQNLS